MPAKTQPQPMPDHHAARSAEIPSALVKLHDRIRGGGRTWGTACESRITKLGNAELAKVTSARSIKVHLLRNLFRYAGRQHYDAIAKALRPVYTAPPRPPPPNVPPGVRRNLGRRDCKS
jgi:hypothetical protein